MLRLSRARAIGDIELMITADSMVETDRRANAVVPAIGFKFRNC